MSSTCGQSWTSPGKLRATAYQWQAGYMTRDTPHKTEDDITIKVASTGGWEGYLSVHNQLIYPLFQHLDQLSFSRRPQDASFRTNPHCIEGGLG